MFRRSPGQLKWWPLSKAGDIENNGRAHVVWSARRSVSHEAQHREDSGATFTGTTVRALAVRAAQTAVELHSLLSAAARQGS